MKNVKTQLHDYLNMNAIRLSMVILLNYKYGMNIICQTSLHVVNAILDTECNNVNKST